jgi:hypothetical protein
MLGLFRDEVAAAEAATAALLADLRFEHLEHAGEDVWYFVAECSVHRNTNHVPVFVERHAKEPAADPHHLGDDHRPEDALGPYRSHDA